MPCIHVRWQAPVPQAKWQATSLPAKQGAKMSKPPPRPKRPSAGPPPVGPTEGCYGGCSICNKCILCRNRMCTGDECSKCNRCAKCRKWKEKLQNGDEDITAKHAIAVKLPPVEVRGVLDPGNSAKMTATAERPKDAAPRAALCPYCQKWLPRGHQENCPSMPFNIWIAATRARNEAKHGIEAVNSWTVQCQHCGTPFPSGASKRVHLFGCERRRTSQDLPLNQHPAIRRI